MPTATGFGKRAMRSIISCPSAASRSASAALPIVTNSSMSAPAMKFSGLPENTAIARTAGSCSSAVKVAMNSSFTARENLLTGESFRSNVTMATPSASSHVSAGPGISAAPAR